MKVSDAEAVGTGDGTVGRARVHAFDCRCHEGKQSEEVEDILKNWRGDWGERGEEISVELSRESSSKEVDTTDEDHEEECDLFRGDNLGYVGQVDWEGVAGVAGADMGVSGLESKGFGEVGGVEGVVDDNRETEFSL